MKKLIVVILSFFLFTACGDLFNPDGSGHSVVPAEQSWVLNFHDGGDARSGGGLYNIGTKCGR